MHIGVSEDKLLDTRGLMGREVVTDDVDLFALGLAGADIGEKRHELSAGVASSGLAQHLSGLGVERSVKRDCAVAVVLEAVALEPSGRQRQHRMEPVQRLD